MEMAERWLEAQKATPSFVSNFEDNISNILDAPLPAALRSSPSNRSMTQNSYVAGSTASPAANRTPRYGNVHDELINRGKLYEQRKEALKERAIMEEKKKLRGQPKISQEAKNLRRDGKIEDRLLRLHKEKKEQHKYDVMKHEKKENDRIAQVATFSPRISKKGHRATAKVSMQEHHDTWQRRREQKLDNRRSEAIMKEMNDVQEGPTINLRSHRLAMKRREREGLAGMSHVEAMVEHDRLSKLALWEKQQLEAEAAAQNPKITIFAATMDRGGSVGDRLYAESFEAEQRKAARVRAALEQQTTAVHTPRITRTANSFGRSQPVEDELMQRHLDSMIAREETLRLQEEQEREVHTPAINPVSDAIAARLPQSSRERLYTPRAEKRRDPNDMGSFQPQTNTYRSVSRSSSAASASNQNRQEWLEGLRKEEDRRKERMRDLKAEHEARELDNCTFAPNTTQRAAESTHATGSVHDRVAAWAKKREMKLQEQREARQDADLQGCTFQPETHSNPASVRRATPMSASDTIYGGDGTPWGVDEFVARQQNARQQRKEGEERATTPTHNWRPHQTKPQEFALGRSRTPVRALQRPIPAPSVTGMGGQGGTASPEQYQEFAELSSSPPKMHPSPTDQYNLPQRGAFSSQHAMTGTAAPPQSTQAPIVPPSMW